MREWIDKILCWLGMPFCVADREAPSYHDLYVTAPGIERTALFNLPYNLEVRCMRSCGWQLWRIGQQDHSTVLVGGEYEGCERWLILDVNGHVIVNSRERVS